MLSVFDQGAHPPCPTPFNLAEYVLSAGASTPDKIALSVLRLSGAERWSYARLIAAVRGVGTGFLEMGLRTGDKVLMRLGNSVAFPITHLGALAAGLVPVPTSSQLTEPEVAKILTDLTPAAVVHQPGVPLPATTAPVVTAKTLMGWHTNAPCPYHRGDPNRLGYIVYTSGTSGTARAVAHAHRAIWARQMMMQGWYGLTADDRLLHAGAFNWTFTLGTGVLDPWTMGATALIPEDRLTAAQLPLLLKRHDATIFAAAPGVFRNMLKTDLPPMPHLRHGLAAGEKLSDPIRTAWRSQTGTEIFEAYGMSECSTFVSGSPDHPPAPGTLGRPQQGRRVAILDGNTPAPRDTPGVIAVHKDDPGLMLGYLNDPGGTQARFAGDWFLTGDLGQMDAQGHITYLGRTDDTMNAGGFRVSPVEVEQALIGVPGITEIAVTEVEVKPDVRIIAAFYVSDNDLPEETLSKLAHTRLAHYKCPRAFVRVDSLPRNANGKVIRKALQTHTQPLITPRTQ